jgi:hypothetical protein
MPAPFPKTLIKSLTNKAPRKTKAYTSEINTQYGSLINAIQPADYQIYMNYYNAYGTPGRKRQFMLNKMVQDGINGIPLQLATIRVNDLYEHQRIMQMLKLRWTRLYDYTTDRDNISTEKFWDAVSVKVYNLNTEGKAFLYPAWDPLISRIALAEYLTHLYDTQKGKCKLTNQQLMPLKGASENEKCAIVLIDSNLGYVPNNIILVAEWVKDLLGDYTLDQFKQKLLLLNNWTHTKNKSTTKSKVDK